MGSPRPGRFRRFGGRGPRKALSGLISPALSDSSGGGAPLYSPSPLDDKPSGASFFSPTPVIDKDDGSKDFQSTNSRGGGTTNKMGLTAVDSPTKVTTLTIPESRKFPHSEIGSPLSAVSSTSSKLNPACEPFMPHPTGDVDNQERVSIRKEDRSEKLMVSVLSQSQNTPDGAANAQMSSAAGEKGVASKSGLIRSIPSGRDKTTVLLEDKKTLVSHNSTSPKDTFDEPLQTLSISQNDMDRGKDEAVCLAPLSAPRRLSQFHLVSMMEHDYHSGNQLTKLISSTDANKEVHMMLSSPPDRHNRARLGGWTDHGHHVDSQLTNQINVEHSKGQGMHLPSSPPCSGLRQKQVSEVVERGYNNDIQILSNGAAQSTGILTSISAPLCVDGPRRSVTSWRQPSLELTQPRSSQLGDVVGNGQLTFEALTNPENIPFVETARQCPVQSSQLNGVVLLKCVPYNVTRAEIIAITGRNSKILNDVDEPVHIIMDRVSSKTNDAYIEFHSAQDALMAIQRWNKATENGRAPRLETRPVDYELSSPSKLMKELFPIAKGVEWKGSHPQIMPLKPREPWNNFKSFVTAEEMTMLVKHVEHPQRSPFSRQCPERAYECMISTLKKFPWYMTSHVTIKQRHHIYDACSKLVRLLQDSLKKGKNTGRLTPQLLCRFVDAIMLCPGFTVTQKDSIAYIVGMPPEQMLEFNLPRSAHRWVHQYTLGPNPNMPLDVVEWYIDLIRNATRAEMARMDIRSKQDILKLAKTTDDYWGHFWCYKKLSGLPSGEASDNMTLAEMADIEWEAMEAILRAAACASLSSELH